MDSKFNIVRKDETLTWQTIVKRISLGFELQDIEGELTPAQILDYNDSIVIAPDYQREYRSSISDESSLVESALLEIPIPPIFLASHKLKGVQVLNVVDGQHRLRAFYRFFEKSYALRDLRILKDFNGFKIDDIPMDDRVELMSRTVTSITFRNFPGKEFELEIFNRYNKGTKPLTPQEIRHAVFGSRVNDMVNNFCSKLIKESKSTLGKAYAISKDRFQKKTCQENIFVILSILENGVTQTQDNDQGVAQKLAKSPQYAESYMKMKSQVEGEDGDNILFTNTQELFIKFNKLIEAMTKVTEYPFSREIYGISLRGNKFQVSISMILAGIMKKMLDKGFDIELLNDEEYVKRLRHYISYLLNDSYLEDPEYKASTTNPIEIQKVVDKFSLDSCNGVTN
jgi:hypothetical protein